MSIDKINAPEGPQQPQPSPKPLIEERDIKAILYLGIRGEVFLPEESHKVDLEA